MSGGDLIGMLAAFAGAIAVLVFVHELGHFAVARRCGVKVLQFSIGFGKPLASWRRGRDQTLWTVSMVPLGGFVKMLDEREAPVAADELHRAFNRKPVWQRMLIVVAGPAANFLLAVLLYWALFTHGVQDLKPVLAKPPAESAAARAGIAAGELVRAVDGATVQSWSELRIELLQRAFASRAATIETTDRQGNIAFRHLDLTAVSSQETIDDPTGVLGLRLFHAPLAPVVGNVVPDSPAERAGLSAGDEIISIGGQGVSDWDQVVAQVQPAAGRPLNIVIVRGGRTLERQITPQSVEDHGRVIGRIGVAVRDDPKVRAELLTTVRYGPWDALGKSLRQTADTSRLTLMLLGKMITGQVSWRNISGPVAIADYAGQSARLGIAPYLGFLALISVSIGILNLLPIPVLDGGHLLYYLLEAIKGSPVSVRLQEVGQYIGLGALGLLMTIALFNDIHRLISG